MDTIIGLPTLGFDGYRQEKYDATTAFWSDPGGALLGVLGSFVAADKWATDPGYALGYTTANIGSFAIPGGAALKAPSAAAKLSKVEAAAASKPAQLVPISPGAENAWTTLNRVDAKGAPFPGYKGGSVFENSAGRLPKIPGVVYREWDVIPNIKGADRGTERIVTGLDGSAYWTNNRYQTFLMFRGAN